MSPLKVWVFLPAPERTSGWWIQQEWDHSWLSSPHCPRNGENPLFFSPALCWTWYCLHQHPAKIHDTVVYVILGRGYSASCLHWAYTSPWLHRQQFLPSQVLSWLIFYSPPRGKFYFPGRAENSGQFLLLFPFHKPTLHCATCFFLHVRSYDFAVIYECSGGKTCNCGNSSVGKVRVN